MLNPDTLHFLRREAKNAGVTKMLLFGSCLRKSEDEAGDIDIAVEGLDKDQFFKFSKEIIFHGELAKRVDIVDLSDDLPFSRLASKKGVAIYEQGR